MVATANILAHFSDSDLALATTFDFEGLPDDVLEHYGVKGMKWGVRKDRKKSGSGSRKKSSSKKSSSKGGAGDSIKEAVSKASSKAVAKVKSVAKERKEKKAAADAAAKKQKERQQTLSDALEKHRKQSSNTINKKYKDFTNDELRALNERMRLEKEYDELTSTRKKQNRSVSQKVADWATDTTVSIASDLAKQQMRKYGEKILSSAIKAPPPPPPPTFKPSKSSLSGTVKKLLLDAGNTSLASIKSASTKTTGNSISARELIEKYGGRPSSDLFYKGRHRK